MNLFSLPLLRRRATARDWWAYFGSFGDDAFDDDDDDFGDDDDLPTIGRRPGAVASCHQPMTARRGGVGRRRRPRVMGLRRRCRRPRRGRSGSS